MKVRDVKRLITACEETAKIEVRSIDNRIDLYEFKNWDEFYEDETLEDYELIPNWGVDLYSDKVIIWVN